MTTYTSITTSFPNAVADATKGLGFTEADWRALGTNCQGVIRRQKALVNTARSDAGIYSGQKFQGYGIFVPNPYYVLLDTSNVLRPRYPKPDTTGWSGPMSITKGGTYTVNVYAPSSGSAAIQINTSEAVILEGCNIVSASTAISIGGYGSVTIRNCKGWGLPPTGSTTTTHGKFVNAYKPRKLLVENNAIHGYGTAILLQEMDDTALASTLVVRRNLIYDINGRLSNGNYPSEKSNGIQFDGQKGRVGQAIQDNFIQNELADTTAEDNINIHNSSGTAGSPIEVSGNLVDQSYGPSGSGLTTDGDKSKQADPATAAAFVNAFENVFLGIRNGSLNNSGGHDNHYYDNVAINANLLPDGSPRPPGTYDYNSGGSISNSTNASDSAFYNNTISNNLFCINHTYYHFAINGRNDLAAFDYTGQGTPYRNNIVAIGDNTYLLGDKADGTASRAMETFWKNYWLQKKAQQNIQLGPLGQWR